MNLGQKMLRSSLWCVLDGWASELANLAIFLLMVRLLGPEAFGLVALALVFTTVAVDLLGYSVSQVLVQREDISPGLCDTVFWLVAGLLGVVCGLLFAGAGLVADLFGEPALATLLRWLCAAALLQGLATVPLALLTRTLSFDVIAKRSLLMIAGGGAVGLTLAFMGFGAYALVGLQLTQGLISALILFGAAGFRPRFAVARTHLRAIQSYVSGVIGNRIAGLFDERAAQFVIGLAIGPAAVGYYNVAMRLVDVLIRMFIVPVSQVALPAIARVQADRRQVRAILSSGIALASLASAPAFIGAAVVAPELVPIALGPAWAATVPVLQLLMLRGLLWPVILYGQQLLFGIGRPGRMLQVNLIDLVANVAILLLVTPFGIVAVAAAAALRVVLVRWPLIGWAIADATGLGLARQAALAGRALLAALLMGGLLLIAREYLILWLDGGLLLTTLMIAGAVLYAALLPPLYPGLGQLLQTLGGRLRLLLRSSAVRPLATSR